MNTTTNEPHRLIARPHPTIRAKCVSPCAGAWSLERISQDEVLRKRLACELISMDAYQAYVLRGGLGSDRVARTTETWEECVLPDTKTIVHYARPADAVRLESHMAVITLLDGRPLIFARSGSVVIGAVFTSRIMSVITREFEDHGIAPRNVNVYAFFAAPHVRMNRETQLRRACAEAGLRVDYQKTLPADEEFGYEEHPRHIPNNLGVLAFHF